jgi:selenocysteine-specific elongation factor
VIIGTAGHIDHGKSSLVEALTGATMDRLREERARGITIELNFAPFDLGDGRVAGVVDVPGHEDFVRTMVAGASGIDLLVLVIAADEGVKPQTREHLAIAEQLGIGRGVPVITKADLVEPEWASLIELEVAEWLKQSPIAFEPPRLVSVVSRHGIAELASHLRQVAASIQPRNADDLFRLPVDRSFSVAGIGTVVTGTSWSGGLAPGDQVLVMPARKSARVRTVQVHGRDVERAEPGMRVALGLAGVGREEISRGDTIVEASTAWEATLALDVILSLLPDAPRVLIPRSRVRLHLGTSEIMARVFPRGARIEPGSTGLARLALESPAVARGGDPFVLRGFSPVMTIGGGRVIDPLPPRKKAVWPEGLGESQPERRLEALIERRPYGISGRQLPILLGVSDTVAGQFLVTSSQFVQAADHWVRRQLVDDLAKSALAVVQSFHGTRPQEPGMPLAELRQNLKTAPWLAGMVLSGLEGNGGLVLQNGMVHLAGFLPRVDGGNEQVTRVVSHIKRAGLTPPSTAELNQALGTGDLTATLRLAAKEGQLEAVERDRYYGREALELFVATLVELGKAGSITPAQLRERLGISRKFLIPLLEWADAKGITMRVAEGRRLRSETPLPWRIPVP